jgi:phosphatidylglycerol lysyltransferase
VEGRVARRIAPLVGLIAFGFVLLALHHALRGVNYHELVADLRRIPRIDILVAALCALGSYLLITAEDALALRYLRRPMPYQRIGLASFTATALSHNVGFAMLSGGSVRMRLYTSWGLSAVEVATLVGFGTATTWLGFCGLAGMAFLAEPVAIPTSLSLPAVAVKVIGGCLIAAVLGYLGWSALGKRPLRLWGWELPVPAPGVAWAQVIVSCADWALAGTALYVLMPDSLALSLPAFLAFFLLAQVIGLASQTPGGLGVFETMLLLMLAGRAGTSALLGSLVVFRAVYYLLPLGVAALMLSGFEMWRRREGLRRVARFFGRWVPTLTPQVLALTTFIGGAILLLSGATPGIRGRLTLLHSFLPLPVIEISHFLGSLAGAGLLLLARGLQRRLDVAYHLAIALLTGGVAFSLLKGFDYEEAAVLCVMLLALVPSRRHFYRRASLLSQPLTPGWVAAIGVVILGSVWLGFFAYRHVEYSAELWWVFAIHANAPRFLRASVGVVAVALVMALARLLRAGAPPPRAVTAEAMDAVRTIVAQSSKTSANLAFLGDKLFLFNDTRTGMVMYAVEGRSWVAMGDPVATSAEAKHELVWSFRELADRHGGWTVFYEVGRDELHLYLELGLTLLKLGEEARVPLAGFSLDGHARKWLRYTVRRVEAEGYSFDIVSPADVPVLLPELRRVSDSWLADKQTREKGFSLGFFDDAYLSNFHIAVVRRDETVIAFANVWATDRKDELSADLMRFLSTAPPGTMDYLFTRLMLWGAERGYGWFNLGMAPLSGLEARALAPLWSKLGAIVYKLGESVYNFKGLRNFKNKFDPAWEPRYLASPGGLALPRILTNVASLVSGGLKGVLSR